MDLLIMAAGMGSRFGGLKQLEPMGPNKEVLIDYSIYDAIKAGFKRIIFIIKEENYELFKEVIGNKIEKYIPVKYVFQKLEDIPSFVSIPKDRNKPWGTAQAIYSARNEIKGPFVIINADDFYGSDAFKVASEFIKNKKSYEYATVGYEASKTLTLNGAVKRGVLEIDDNNSLKSIIECEIQKENNKIKCVPLNNKEIFYINDNDLVSMNMLILDETIFPYLEKKMVEFFKDNENNLKSIEFLIPEVLNEAHNENYASVKVLHTVSFWMGVTYKEDTEIDKKSLKDLIQNKEYPFTLWK